MAEYVKRAQRFEALTLESFRSEDALLQTLARRSARVPPRLVLLETRGRQLTSAAFAEYLQQERDQGTQELLFAIGPADGWSDLARQRCVQQISFGAMTLPHELALLLLAEQTYRALTILAGHPYHSGHE